MIIKSTIIFTDEYHTELLGKSIDQEEEIQFDLKHVSGIMPGENPESSTIIFLGGRDLVVKIPYEKLSILWNSVKNVDERIN
jgi:hypothetical protein